MDRAVGEHRASAPLLRNGTSPVRPRHAAAVLRTDAELLAVALPFLDAGLRAGDVVALTCPPEVAALLCEELGERAAQVRSDPRLSLLGARAPDALARARRTAEQAPDAGQLRILSLVDFGPVASGWREGLRFESASNRIMAGAR
ncbi:MAG TPA: MEDS domain-containing protein, partial [Geodermatophilus sp.]|nr:MEDS domain-containing protein [Geodermatophilus sp.]